MVPEWIIKLENTDEPKAQELVGSLPKQSWRRKGGKEWVERRKVLPSSKHRSLADTGMPTNEAMAVVRQKEDVMERRRKEEEREADNEGMTVPC